MDSMYFAAAEIKPLNFDESDNENDENNDPGCASDEEVRALSYSSKKRILEQSTPDSSFFQSGSESFMVIQKHLQPPNATSYLRTPGPSRITRKRKYCEPVKFDVTLPHMPNEVLDQIFSNLNKRDLLAVGSTCRRFFQVSSSSMHWESINLSTKRIIESSLHRIISRKTKALCMTSTVVYTDPALITRTLGLCNLTKLDFSWAKFPDTGLAIMKGILNRCDKLQYLALEDHVVDTELLQLIAKNRDLSALNLSSCQVIDAHSLNIIFKSCTKLTDVNLSWTYPDEATSNVIINEIPSSVKRLALAGMNDRKAFNDVGLIKILHRLPHLIDIDIGDNMVASSAFISELTKRPHLREITASRCLNIEPISFLSLKQVRVMNLFGCVSNSTFGMMMASLPGVTINSSPFTKIGRSQEGDCLFWGDDISEPY